MENKCDKSFATRTDETKVLESTSDENDFAVDNKENEDEDPEEENEDEQIDDDEWDDNWANDDDIVASHQISKTKVSSTVGASNDKGFDLVLMAGDSKRSNGGSDGGEKTVSVGMSDLRELKQKSFSIHVTYLRELELERTKKEVEQRKVSDLRKREGKSRITKLCDCMQIKFDEIVIERVISAYALYLHLALDKGVTASFPSALFPSAGVYPPHTSEYIKDLTSITAFFQGAETKEAIQNSENGYYYVYDDDDDDDENEPEKETHKTIEIGLKKYDSQVYQTWLATVSLGCPQLIDALCATKTFYFRDFEEDRLFNGELIVTHVLLYS